MHKPAWQILAALLILIPALPSLAAGNAADPDASSASARAEQRFREIQARGGSAAERDFRNHTAQRRVVNQPPAAGSALDLTKRDITGATSIGGGGFLTLANAAKMLEGKVSAAVGRDICGGGSCGYTNIKVRVAGGRVFFGGADVGSVQDCMLNRNCWFRYSTRIPNGFGGSYTTNQVASFTPTLSGVRVQSGAVANGAKRFLVPWEN